MEKCLNYKSPKCPARIIYVTPPSPPYSPPSPPYSPPSPPYSPPSPPYSPPSPPYSPPSPTYSPPSPPYSPPSLSPGPNPTPPPPSLPLLKEQRSELWQMMGKLKGIYLSPYDTLNGTEHCNKFITLTLVWVTEVLSTRPNLMELKRKFQPARDIEPATCTPHHRTMAENLARRLKKKYLEVLARIDGGEIIMIIMR